MTLSTFGRQLQFRTRLNGLLKLSRKLAAVLLITSVAGTAYCPRPAQARGMGGGGSSMGHSSGGSIGHGGTSMGHGVGSSGGRVGGGLPHVPGNFGGYHGGNGGNGPMTLNGPSHTHTFIPYYRSGPNVPWTQLGTYNNQAEALRARQLMQDFGYDAFLRSR